MKKNVMSALACALLLAGCGAAPVVIDDESSSSVVEVAKATSSSVASTRVIRLISPDGAEIAVTIEDARTQEELERGLMHRTELAPGTGMLFTFSTERILNFWMRNTLIPLDILYFDAAGNLVSTASMVPCEAMPCPTYPSERNALYALEVPVGSVAEWGVTTDWRLEQ